MRTLVALAVLAAVGALAADEESKLKKVDFAREVRPILKARCLECHNPERRDGGLSVASRADLLKGGAGGPAIIPGSSRESPLVQRVTGFSAPVMPFASEPLTEAQIQTLRDWVDQGAEWPAGA
jgi:mono/diheme cytochrome c family protein